MHALWYTDAGPDVISWEHTGDACCGGGLAKLCVWRHAARQTVHLATTSDLKRARWWTGLFPDMQPPLTRHRPCGTIWPTASLAPINTPARQRLPRSRALGAATPGPYFLRCRGLCRSSWTSPSPLDFSSSQRALRTPRRPSSTLSTARNTSIGNHPLSRRRCPARIGRPAAVRKVIACGARSIKARIAGERRSGRWRAWPENGISFAGMGHALKQPG